MNLLFSLTLAAIFVLTPSASKKDLGIPLEDALQIVFDQPQVASRFNVYPRFQHDKAPLFYLQEHTLLSGNKVLTINKKPIGILKPSPQPMKSWEYAIRIEKVNAKSDLISLELSYRDPKLFLNQGKEVFFSAELKKENDEFRLHKLEVTEK